ncbi:MAG TPA: hypothetical protein VJY42_02260 [Candidatus Methanomethylophilaceae archaeon]|nr:hypothetical protein [Candidatus Methanomethylophilaceae archaeon]
MSMDAPWMLMGFVVGMGSCILGHLARRVTRQGLVVRCPILIAMIAAEIVAIILGTFVWPLLVSAPVQVIAMCTIVGYSVGYSISDPGDGVAIDMIDDYNNSTASLVYTYFHDSNRYLMPQSFWGCVKALAGARCPLYMDMQFARRTRSHKTSSRFLSVELTAYVAQSHTVVPDTVELCRIWTSKKIGPDGDIVEIPRYLFRAEIEHHFIEFAQSTIEDPATFLVKTDTYHEALAEAAKARAKATRVEVEKNNAGYTSAAAIIEQMFALDIDGPEVEAELRRRIQEINERIGGEDENATDIEDTYSVS